MTYDICHNGAVRVDDLDGNGGFAGQALDCGREVAANGAVGAAGDGARLRSSFERQVGLGHYDTRWGEGAGKSFGDVYFWGARVVVRWQRTLGTGNPHKLHFGHELGCIIRCLVDEQLFEIGV